MTVTAPPEGRTELAAVRDILPIAASVVPFAVVIGSVMRQMGIPGWIGVLGGAGMYGGTAQLAALTLFGAGAELGVILTAVAVINARLLIYGAGLEPRFHGQPAWFRWLAPQFIVDQTYALVSERDDLDDPRRFRRYWLVCGAVLGLIWVASMAAGMLVGGALPASSPLNFAATAVLIALLMPRLRSVNAVVVTGVAAAVAVIASDLPNGLGIGLGMAAGMAVGTVRELTGRRGGDR